MCSRGIGAPLSNARKICTGPDHKGSRWLLAVYFHVNGWTNDQTEPYRLQSRCICCQRIINRERLGIKKRGVPYRAHVPSLRKFNASEYRRQKREYYNNNKEEINEHRRMVYAEQSRRRITDYLQHSDFIERQPENKRSTKRPDVVTKSNIADYSNIIYSEKLVDIGPFKKWLNEWHSHPDNYWEILAYEMNINESRLRQIAGNRDIKINKGNRQYIYKGGQKRITLDFVDRCLIAAGADTMLWELYDVD